MGSEDDSSASIFSSIKQAFSGSKRSVSEEEILELVDDNDELHEDEKRMIGEILALDDLTAAEIMCPRVDIMAMDDTETLRAALERMRGTGFSRLPVYHEDLDSVVGIVHYKDLIPAVLDGDTDGRVTDYMSEALFVPETKDIFPLLSEMQEKHKQMAIVVDEYGGTDGLITVEDIIEEIVGEISDESDSLAPLIIETAPGEWVVDGRLPIDDAQEAGFPVKDSDDYETVAGWLMNQTEAVPKVGDEFEVGDFRFKVRAMRRRRIQKLSVSRSEPKDGSSEEVVLVQES